MSKYRLCYFKDTRKITAVLHKVIDKLLEPMDEQGRQRFFVNLLFRVVTLYCFITQIQEVAMV
jgi:hypothetical protein